MPFRKQISKQNTISIYFNEVIINNQYRTVGLKLFSPIRSRNKSPHTEKFPLIDAEEEKNSRSSHTYDVIHMIFNNQVCLPKIKKKYNSFRVGFFLFSIGFVCVLIFFSKFSQKFFSLIKYWYMYTTPMCMSMCC